jgi:hypothetical protein
MFDAKRILHPCRDCGRLEVDENDTSLVYWFEPCPSDDCPSHENDEACNV